MTHGRKTCKILKEIRQQIAEKNEIEYLTSECHFQGECQGSCPKCEAELKYLENELHKRRQLGKVVTVAGISLGIAGTFSTCNSPKQENGVSEQEKTIEVSLTEWYDTIEQPIYTMIGFFPEIIPSGEIIDIEPYLWNDSITSIQGGIGNQNDTNFQLNEE